MSSIAISLWYPDPVTPSNIIYKKHNESVVFGTAIFFFFTFFVIKFEMNIIIFAIINVICGLTPPIVDSF